MQHSACLTIRSLVTIVAAVAVPALAVCLPTAGAHSVHEGTSQPTAKRPAPRSSMFGGGTLRQATPFAPATPLQGMVASGTPGAAHLVAKPDTHATRPAAPFWGDEELAERPALASHQQPARPSGVRPNRRLQPTQRRLPESLPERSTADEHLAATSEPPKPHVVLPAETEVLQAQLREMGATQYRLETWGERGDLFRFRCMMSLNDRATHSRYFEATDRDPVQAMRRVVTQIERWQAVKSTREQ